MSSVELSLSAGFSLRHGFGVPFFLCENPFNVSKCFGFFHFGYSCKLGEDGLVVETVSAGRPLGLADEAHNRVVVNGLSG
jgi:hypothetical protein